MTIKRYTASEIKKRKGKTNWQQLENKTEREIERSALNDKDAPLITDYDANKFKPRSLMRHKLGLKD